MPHDVRSSWAGAAAASSTNVTSSRDRSGTLEGFPDPPATTPLGRAGLGSAPSTWQAGTHFSRYEIDSRLAAGGMAEVWRAKLKGVRGFEKRIVIKTMLPQLAGRPDLVEMFINEATLASAFSHPNIAHVYDFGQLEGRYFIAMEYVPGVTLRFAHKRMLARNELLPMTTVLHVMVDVCDALQVVHDMADGHGPLGLLHRDLSPDNVIVSTSGAAKLIDFGAARATERTPAQTAFVGKYRYAAPERIRRTSEDRRSDVYSAGVILYECLTGARPHEGNDQQVIAAVALGRRRDPRERRPSLPASVAAAVTRALAFDPDQRFASARDLRDALAHCLIELGGPDKEEDVTGALAALIEAPLSDTDRVLLPRAEAAPAAEPASGPSSGIDVALCEVEIIEASGPIQMSGEPPPLPAIPTHARADLAASVTPPPRPRQADPSAPHWSLPGQLFDRVFGGPASASPGVLGWRRTPDQPPPESHGSPAQRAVELFDRGVALRMAGRYGEALQAWERALALAPDNRVYESNVLRLRQQLNELRRAERQLQSWDD